MESCEKTEFEQRLARAADRTELESLSAQLAPRPETWAKTMRLMIGWKLASSRQRDSPRIAAAGPPASFVELLRFYGLPAPDGRPLFQYQLGNDEFQRLEGDVRQRAAAGALGAKLAPGLFVLWAADWFRRRHRGGMRRWLDIEDALGCELEQSKWREYTDRGLKLWGRRALFINGTRHRLLTLAREGGFPVAALEGDAGWASRLLTNTVGGLLGLIEPDEEIAFKLARSNAGYAPSSWQDEDFFSLCADLALAIVELRRQADAPAAAAGLPVSVWLDANWPDWRTTLPITADNEAGKKLVDGLMRAEPIKLRAGDVRAARILRKEGGSWVSVLRLNLTGLISGDAVKGLDRDYGRLRAFASGELARYINGELALVEPPEEGEDGWLVRPLHRGKREAAVPLHVPAELELRADGRPIKRITLPSGTPVRSSLLTFAVEAEDDDGPIELIALGTGSGSYRAESVCIHAPDDWRMESGGESETIDYLGDGLQGNCLWRVKGGAIVVTPAGDKYRILTGQTADRRDRLVLLGEAPKYLCACDPKIELFSGCPSVRVREGSIEKAARHEELFVRAAGGAWAPAALPLPAGLYDIGWKHRQTGHLRDRRRIGIVPSALNIGMRGNRHSIDYRITGWTGLSLEGIQAGTDGRWSFPVSSNTSRFAKCRLKWDDGSEASAELPVPHQAGFARWGGSFLPPKSIFTLADAPDIVACSDVPVTLMARLRDRGRRPVEGAELRWVVDDELPVSAIRDDLASLLLPCGDIDAEVELGFNDGIEDYWHVRLFDGALEIERGRVVASKGVLDRDARLVGRALSNPVEELDLGAFSLQDTLNHRPLELPKHLYGPWLIYLRTADAIITRPTRVHEKAMQVCPADPLAKAMCLDSFTDREEALDGLCNLILEGGEKAYELIRAIIALACSLRGLAPASFDILKRVAPFPGVAARLALFSTDNEKPEILSLSDGLPFAWHTIPKQFWDDAAAAYFEFYMPKLEPVYGAGAAAEVSKMVAASARAAAEIQPLLAFPLGLSCPSFSILEAAQGFIRRSADKVTDLRSTSIFRDGYAGDLPACFSRFEPRYLGVLDAPCAAALAGLGRITLNATELRRIKAVERENPLYFAEAFSAWYQEKLHG